MKPLLRLVPLLTCLAIAVSAQETIVLSNERGASVTFTQSDDGWQATRLNLPLVSEGGWETIDRAVEIATLRDTQELAPGWKLASSGTDRVVFEQAAVTVGLEVRRVFSFGPASNALRIETWVRSPDAAAVVAQVGLLNWKIPGETFWEMGQAPASFPLFGGTMFAGIEHVSGESHTGGESIRLAQRPRLAVGSEWTFVAAAIIGWPTEGMGAGLPEGAVMREAFLHYLDTVRVKPDRLVLHSETWWTMMPPLFEKDVLADIESLRRDFFGRTGMFFDTYCLDLGWSNPQTLWGVAENRFPNGFRQINERLNGLGAKLGLWFSPGSGYPDGLSNPWLKSQGYEMTPFGRELDEVPCFALGTRYQREFKERVVSYAREYGLGHVILDFMAQSCDVAAHGHPPGEESRYAIAAGVADVLDSLRAVNPNFALEPMVCGYPPSPWWLMKTPFILGPAGDDVPFGRVPSPEWMESLVTSRDIAYRAGQEAWLMPTQALETWDIIVQTPGEFENTAVMAIGRGRWFLSSYLKPSLMKPEDWDFLAALVRWARANREHLGNAYQIGGQPELRETYGYMFRSAAKDLFCVRNPWVQPGTITLPASSIATEARELRMIYPRRATLARLEPGEAPPPLQLGPYETVFLETVPATEDTTVSPVPENPIPDVAGDPPVISVAGERGDTGEVFGLRYQWTGTVTVPDIESPQLHVLIEAEPGIEHTLAEIKVNGRVVQPQRSASAGQFGAAIDASPENWLWLIVPIARGENAVAIDLRAPVEAASVGVFLRGSVTTHNEPAPEGAVFPVFNPTRRVWSGTVLPSEWHESPGR